MAGDAKGSSGSQPEETEPKGFWARTGIIATAITALCAAIGGVVALVHILLPNSSASTAAYQHQVVAFCGNMNALSTSYGGAAIDQTSGNYIRTQFVSALNGEVNSGQALVMSLAAITPPSSLINERTAALQAWDVEAHATTAYARYLQNHLPAEFTEQQLQTAIAVSFPNWRSLESNVNASFAALAGQNCQAIQL
jgi:hypothetical protein